MAYSHNAYMEDIMESADIRQAVQKKYGEIATAVKSGGGGVLRPLLLLHGRPHHRQSL